MPFGGFERHGGTHQPMAEINVTPLVDVMLVLLVIFIITAPLLSYAIRLDLPNEAAPAADVTPATIKLSIDADGLIYWDADVVGDDQLRARLTAAGRQSTAPEVHLRADKATRYERIAFVLATAQQAGLLKIGFVTEPAAAATPARP
ncbi:MAG: Biopolymer transport protein ExbD/TolR [Burkholderiaceae bacterium]|jgi:biopolymer transport protein ExbD|nr:Biopolymer transport protein ExbD/TolR [Burkholderiaceae bacterium]